MTGGLLAASSGRPLPTPTSLSLPHWDGCRRQELLAQRCTMCGRAAFPPTRSCHHCGSTDLRWEPSAGRGAIYSFTVVWRPQLATYQAPYIIAVVELDEGWHMFTNVLGCEVQDVHIGMAVTVQFVRHSDDITLPFFVPADDVTKGASA